MTREYKRIVVEKDCTGCKTCDVACKQEHGLPVELRWTRVTEDGPRIMDGKMQMRYQNQDCRHYNNPPCRQACPAGVNAYGYITEIARGNFEKALDVLRETMPFAGVCGRICTRPCESVCEKSTFEKPVAIRQLKRFISDYELKFSKGKAHPVKKIYPDKIAIVGSGPSGLACAYDLVKKGYDVTVFEAETHAGGLLRYVIPDYRLPVSILEHEIQYIKDLGVSIKTNKAVSGSKDLIAQGYKAVFVATGVNEDRKLGLDNEESEGIYDAVSFLKEVKSGKKPRPGDRVLVIGGGNSAFDAARTALRLGSKEVTILYRRTVSDMPADDAEIQAALAEGVKFRTRSIPVRIVAENGRFTGLEISESKSEKNNISLMIKADLMIVAIGQKPDVNGFPELERIAQGGIKANEFSLETNLSGVFTGGDAVSGPYDVINAIAMGKEAAISIDRYCRGVNLIESRMPVSKKSRPPRKSRENNREFMETIKTEPALLDSSEDEPGLTEELAVQESRRCFTCGICMEKLDRGMKPACAAACSARCIHFDTIVE
jgi:heterodisulfide reductase subunit A2